MSCFAEWFRALCTPTPLRTLEAPAFVTPVLSWQLWGPQ